MIWSSGENATLLIRRYARASYGTKEYSSWATLVVHSEGDLRCNIEQSEQVFMALKLRRIPTRFVRYPKTTSHGMSRNGPPDLRLHRLGQYLAWWEKYLK